MLPAIRSQKWFVLVRRSFLLRAFLLCLLHLGAAGARGETVAWLSWDVPDPSQGIISYQIYWGTSSHNYDNSETSYYINGDIIDGLQVGQTYYFAVAAVNTNGQVSALSQELVYTVPQPPLVKIQSKVIPDANGNPLFFDVSGSWSGTYDWELDYSFDLQNWNTWQGGKWNSFDCDATFGGVWGDQVFFRLKLY